MSENQKKSVYELPKMVTDNPQGNFEVMLNLVYAKDGRSYIRYSDDGTDGMPITDFCFKKLCPEFGCSAFADQTMTDEEQDELLFDCVFDNCPVATVYAALSGYGHLRDRLRQHEDAMTNRVLTLEEIIKAGVVWLEGKPLPVVPAIVYGEVSDDANSYKTCIAFTERCGEINDYPVDDYGKHWRSWLRKPTKEEMEGTPWES